MHNSEKRRARRISIDFEAVVHKIGAHLPLPDKKREQFYECFTPDMTDLGKRFEARVKDLSEYGAFIVANQALPVLSRIKLEFQLPGYGKISAIALVIWRRKRESFIEINGEKKILLPGFGVLFEYLPFNDRQAIHNYITEKIRG